MSQGGMADYAMLILYCIAHLDTWFSQSHLFHSQLLLLLDYQLYKNGKTEKVAITEIGRQCT
jgi:hypothetical protein